MRYCLSCKSGVKRQFAKHCFECGDKLVDVPTTNCECGNEPKSHNVFCTQCGKELEVKQLKQEVEV